MGCQVAQCLGAACHRGCGFIPELGPGAPYADHQALLFLAIFFLVVSKFLSVSQTGLVAGVQSQKLLQALERPTGWVGRRGDSDGR